MIEVIEKRMNDRLVRIEVNQDKVIQELASIAFANITDYVNIEQEQLIFTTDDGLRISLENEAGSPKIGSVVKLTDTDKLDKTQIKAIAGIKQGKNGIEISMYDKTKALEMLGRHLGMFKDKVEVSGLDDAKNKLDDLISQMRGD